MSDINNYIQKSQDHDIDASLKSTIKELQEESLFVEFGKIGNRTTYALIHNEDHSIEIVGYTFIKNLKYYRENVGNLKALQQAMARKKLTEEEE